MEEPVLMDALPYVDIRPTPQQREAVEALIAEEMAKFQPTDYLEHMPVPSVKVSKLVEEEMARVAQGRPLPPLDRSRFELRPPSSDYSQDLGRWTKSIQNAQAQYEHQVIRQQNLELLIDHGKEGWLARNKALEQEVKHTGEAVVGVKRKIDELNAYRKSKQKKAGAQLKELEIEWQNSFQRNIQLQSEIRRQQAEVARVRRAELGD
ncbi:Pre-mRNA-splicing factor spf27 [Diplonema papillatum]|nr:Pre-mRNA-splicing factor spf27 [Diplonema papillatum]